MVDQSQFQVDLSHTQCPPCLPWKPKSFGRPLRKAVLRLASFCVGTQTGFPKKAGQVHVSAALESLSWDLVLIQEGALNVAQTRRFVSIAGHEWIEGAAPRSKGGLAFIVRKGLKLKRFHWLHERVAWILVELPGGTEVACINAYMPHCFGNKDTIAAANVEACLCWSLIREAWQSLSVPSRKIFIGDDFNGSLGPEHHDQVLVGAHTFGNANVRGLELFDQLLCNNWRALNTFPSEGSLDDCWTHSNKLLGKRQLDYWLAGASDVSFVCASCAPVHSGIFATLSDHKPVMFVWKCDAVVRTSVSAPSCTPSNCRWRPSDMQAYARETNVVASCWDHSTPVSQIQSELLDIASRHRARKQSSPPDREINDAKAAYKVATSFAEQKRAWNYFRKILRRKGKK